ncbi:MAG: FtsQ-type POTRA domain-containing protein [Coriobacteriales bacterium]|nr:FtsQ-type POTRA domain-containing protein [Coriobacteriales bacterium]
MATNYNRRSGSSGSADNRGQRRTSSGASSSSGSRPRSNSSPRRPRTSNRTQVNYEQSAYGDLGTKARQTDSRARSARTRPLDKVRVLEESYSQDVSNRNASRTRRQPMTVREHRKRYQKSKGRRSRHPFFTFLIVLVVSVLVLTVAGLITYNSSAFTIKVVKVEGAQRLPDTYLQELAAIPQGMTLLRVDTNAVALRVESDVWVESVQVKRTFPATLTLVITEQSPAAVVEIAPVTANDVYRYWLISADGHWLCSLKNGAYELARNPDMITTPAPAAGGVEGDGSSSEAPDDGADTSETAETPADEDEGAVDAGGEDAPAEEGTTDGEGTSDGAEGAVGSIITPSGSSEIQESSLSEEAYITAADVQELTLVKGVTRSLEPAPGGSIIDEGILNALAIIEGFSPEMLAMVEYISAPDKVKTMITLDNHVGVAFGAAEDIPAKEIAILTLLNEHGGKITYINVRVADRASYRATE